MLIKGDKRVVLDGSRFFVDGEINVAKATKVLGISSTGSILQEESLQLQGEVRAKCRVTSVALCLGEDGSVFTAETTAEQTVSLRNSEVEQGCNTMLNLVVIDTEYVGINTIKVRTELEISGFAYRQITFEPCTPSEDILVKDTPVVTERVVPITPGEFVASASHGIKENIDEILTTNTSVVLNKVSTATEVCELAGDCYTYITYLSSGILQSRCLVTPFETEVLASGVGSSDKAFCKATAESTTVSIEGSDVKTEIILKAGGFAIVYEEVSCVCDCYSKEKEVKAEYATFAYQENTCIAGSVEKLGGTVRLGEGDKRIRSVLAVIGASAGAADVTGGDSLVAEGILRATVVYLDEDDAITSVKVSLPYKFLLDRDFPCKDSVECMAKVLCTNAKARHNDELDISAEIAFDVLGASERSKKYLKNLEILGDKERDDATISLYYVADGEGLWDVAKALSSDEDTIMALNPDLTLPLKEGDKVLLYRE